MIEKTLAAVVLAVCLVMLVRMFLRGHPVMRVVLRMRVERRAHRGSKQSRNKNARAHSSTLTSRIIPASMWNSRWQW